MSLPSEWPSLERSQIEDKAPSLASLPELVPVVPTYKELKVPQSVHLLHAVAHVEATAIASYWDTLVRFGCQQQQQPDLPAEENSLALPEEFRADLTSVCDDEARHFLAVQNRLTELGCSYGDLPASSVIPEMAASTGGSLTARLAVVPLVQEARGLDAGPRFVNKLRSVQDHASADLIEAISLDELRHVKLGVKWFKFICAQLGKDPRQHFQALVSKYMSMGLSPPFHVLARSAAGLAEDWYFPLVDAKFRHQPMHIKKYTVDQDVVWTRRMEQLQQEEQQQTTQSSTLHKKSKKQKKTRGAVYITPHLPDLTSSAAGVRAVAILDSLLEGGYDVQVASPSASAAPGEEERERRSELAQKGIGVWSALPNSLSFEKNLLAQQPQVRRDLPSALRVLDTQDLHFLRALRHALAFAELPTSALASGLQRTGPSVQSRTHFDGLAEVLAQTDGGSGRAAQGKKHHPPNPWDIRARELAAIHRSDLSLMVSPVESRLLQQTYQVAADKLITVPFFYSRQLSEQVKTSSWEGRPGFSHRRDVAMIGNFLHAPNVDSAEWARQRLWPALRQRLPHCQLHIYGSHAPPACQSWTDPDKGVYFKGKALDQHVALSSYRVLLAPLRFGAGCKGKIADAWAVGTPVVTTTVGAEGMSGIDNAVNMGPAAGDLFGGIVADTEPEMVDAVVRLCEQRGEWEISCRKGLYLGQLLFDFNASSDRFLSALAFLLDTQSGTDATSTDSALVVNTAFKNVSSTARSNFELQRENDWLGGLLWHHTLASARHLGRYLELKRETAETAICRPDQDSHLPS
eukprot:g69063.t1